MGDKILHPAREQDATKKPAWIQILGNRQEEEALTRQRSQVGDSSRHLRGREGQCVWSRVNEARGRGKGTILQGREHVKLHVQDSGEPLTGF